MNNVMNDILKLLTIIANSEEGASIRELHEKTKMPLEVIKDNLENLWYNAELYLIDIAPENEEEYETHLDNYEDLKWTIENFSEDTKVLNLNYFEKYLYKSILTKSEKRDGDFLGIINKSTYDIEDYKYKLFQISIAAENKRALCAKYKTRNNKVEEFVIEPLGIVFYEFENLFYVVGQYNNTIVNYRIDRILSIKETKNNFVPLEGFDIEQYLANIWGMEQGESIKVKIKFMKEANVIYRVKRDLEYRLNKKLTEYDGYFIYEDIIIGVNSFKSWLRSFGSSVIVLEPKELREEMIESAKRSFEYYAGGMTNE
ncbi:WYL domain-containing protein [Clostridium sp. YIM B02551]|uniref:WYL domain-containing protein n=1 Tax=Clostridium sp. YIM B02551 TaxID=2910679 RepID=UPI001EEA7D62|nr:WYL domain-containing protein [Clostridium sp. YIM B02551]